MTNDEFREMIEFLGRKFDEVDTRFERVVTKEELRTQQEETRRHFEVVGESLRDQVRTVAEGVVNLDGKLEGLRGEVEREFTEVKSMIRFSYAELERRIHALEQGYRSLEDRIARVEARQG
jgi:uncharacterized protein involved in exopolysaccharide biosynthesis